MPYRPSLVAEVSNISLCDNKNWNRSREQGRFRSDAKIDIRHNAAHAYGSHQRVVVFEKCTNRETTEGKDLVKTVK